MTAPQIDIDRRSLIVWTAASLFLVAVLVGIALLGVGSIRSATAAGWSFPIAAIACLVPYLVVLILLARDKQPGAFTLGAAYGLSAGASAILITLAVAAVFGRLGVLLTVWSLPMIAGLLVGLIRVAESLYLMGPIALIVLVLLALVQFRLAAIARQARVASTSATDHGWSIGRFAGFTALCAVALTAMSGKSQAEQASAKAFEESEQQRMSENAGAYRALLRLQACAAAYADSESSNGYPATLAAMGPAGSRCLESSTASGTSAGYLLHYHPIADSVGRNVGWWAVARRRPNVQRRDEAFMADYTGALYLRPAVYDPTPTRDEVDSSVALHQYITSELPRWISVAQCIRDAYAAIGEGGGYPSDLTHIDRKQSPRCMGDDKRNSVVWGDYLLTYSPEQPDRHGRIRGFALHAKPLHYGRDAVRSFLIQPDSVVHVTVSQRAATTSDPVYVGCELETGLPCRIAQ